MTISPTQNVTHSSGPRGGLPKQAALTFVTWMLTHTANVIVRLVATPILLQLLGKEL